MFFFTDLVLLFRPLITHLAFVFQTENFTAASAERAPSYFVFFITLPYKNHKSVRGTPFQWIYIPLTETEYDVGQILPPRVTSAMDLYKTA
jgi:hypothetical protein